MIQTIENLHWHISKNGILHLIIGHSERMGAIETVCGSYLSGVTVKSFDNELHKFRCKRCIRKLQSANNPNNRDVRK